MTTTLTPPRPVSKCQAKDPATCPYHGAYIQYESALNAGDADAALAARNKIDLLEAQNITDDASAEKFFQQGSESVADISNQTPAAIDGDLANLYYEESKVMAENSRIADNNNWYERNIARTTNEHVIAGYRRNLAQNNARIAENNQKIAEIRAKMAPGEAEFRRRGGWTRAFLVVNGDGHVHRSMNCSTCNHGAQATRFNWLTEYSGKDEAQVVEDAGKSACTVCYPSAPAETRNRPSRIEDPDKRAKRLEREKKAAEKARKEAITGIKNPDGTELRIKSHPGDRYGQTIKTERTAEMEAVGNVVYRRSIEASAHPESQAAQPEFKRNMDEQLTILINALAHKRNQTPEEVRAFIEEKGRKKYEREYNR